MVSECLVNDVETIISMNDVMNVVTYPWSQPIAWSCYWAVLSPDPFFGKDKLTIVETIIMPGRRIYTEVGNLLTFIIFNMDSE
jgi:hypothetical protein